MKRAIAMLGFCAVLSADVDPVNPKDGWGGPGGRLQDQRVVMLVKLIPRMLSVFLHG